MATIDRLAPGVYAEPPLTVIAVAGVGLNVAAAAAAGAGCGGLRLAYACGVTSGREPLVASIAPCPSAAQPAAGTLALAPLVQTAPSPLGSTWFKGSLPT
jgi:hypothetical protein